MWAAWVALAALLLAQAAADGGQRRLLGTIPRPHTAGLSLRQLDESLDVLSELLEETRLPSGGIAVRSQLAAPTRFSDSQTCKMHTDIFWQELQSGSTWAAAMFDATGKLPDGILVGNLNAWGSWDECLQIEAYLDPAKYPNIPPDQRYFRGRYVPVQVFPPAPMVNREVDGAEGGDVQADRLGEVIINLNLGMATGVMGMCVPSSCSSEDVAEGLHTLLGNNVTVAAFESKTATDTVSLSSADIVVIVLMALVGALMVAGTALDLYHRWCAKVEAKEVRVTSVVDSPNSRLPAMLHVLTPKPASMRQRKPVVLGTGQRALIAFSVYTNTKKLLDTSTSKGSLTCLHGIRFITMTWVVIGHAVSQTSLYSQNFVIVVDWLKGPWFSAVANATPSVDTFYLLSGLLVAYVFFNTHQKTKKFNLPMFYIHRYLRLTPALMIMVAISATWYIHLGDGPLWHQADDLQKLCQDYWWRNLLYIQNFFTFGDTCVGQTWYLASDMQMYVFAPVVLLPLIWRPKLGMAWLGFLTVAFVALRTVIWDVKDLLPTILVLRYAATGDEFIQQYGYPWNRIPVWLVGIALGYLLHRIRGRQVVLRPWVWIPGWLAAFATGILVIYGIYPYQMPWEPISKAVAVTYGGLHRTAWGLAVAWVIFACVTGYGGFINTFLSYPGFIPLSRLTYAGYLVHINVLYFTDVTMKGTMYVDEIRLVYRLLAHVITTFAFAVPLSLAFEVPFMNLEKIMFGPGKTKTDISNQPVHQAGAEQKHQQ